MVQEDNEQFEAMLAGRQDWHVWLLEFGLTHFVMTLALHTGIYLRHTKVQCVDPMRFEGDIQGGPYALQLRPVDWRGESLVELRSADGALRIVAASFKVIGRRA